MGQQICYEAEQVPLGLGDMLAAMQERRHVVVMMLVLDERIGREYGTEPLTGVAGLIPDVSEMLKVTGDLALVPGQQDRLDVGKVLVEGRSPAAPTPRCRSVAAAL